MGSNINDSQGYHGNVKLQFEYGKTAKKKIVNIRNEQIIYIMIEENYMDRVLPVIYISLSVNSSLYNKIIDKSESAHFYLNITSRDILSSNSVPIESVSGKFKYIPETTNTDYGSVLNAKVNENEDTSFRTITIGLVSEDQTKQLRRSFNGIYKNVNSSTLISIATEELKNVVIEPVENNVYYNEFILPPVSSIYKFLEYLYSKDSFYNTPFRFFMTFNKVYLLSQRGIPVKNTNNSVIISIEDVTSNTSLMDGITKKNGSYFVYINAIDTKISVNRGSSQIVNNIVSYDDTVSVSNYKLNNNDNGRVAYIRSEYGNVAKNKVDSSDLRIDILKKNIDTSIFTPDKKYSFRGSGENAKYNGNYILIYKRTFYKSVDGSYIITCNLGFKPTSDNETAHTDADTVSTSSLAVPKSARKTTTATSIKTSATTMSRSTMYT